MPPVEFEWDEVKSEANFVRRGIDFEAASAIFLSDLLVRKDSRRNYGEDRFIALGVVNGRELVVVYTIREGRVRIISARKANRDEQGTYRQTITDRVGAG